MVMVRSGPIGTAIMSRSMMSPERIPASSPAATMSVSPVVDHDLDFDVGIGGQDAGKAGPDGLFGGILVRSQADKSGRSRETFAQGREFPGNGLEMRGDPRRGAPRQALEPPIAWCG
jgi:hypothetical protein